MLVSHSERPDVRRFIRLNAKRQPTVLLGANNPGVRVPIVGADDRAAGRMAAEHLLSRGHKRLVWYNIFHGAVVDARRDGFAETITAAGRDCTLLEEIPSGRKALDWNRRRLRLLARLRQIEKPCGLFAVDDQLAAEAIEVCLEAGLRVPGDVSVVGVGNLDLACAASLVPISSVDMRDTETAYRAAQLLDGLMGGGPPPESPVFLLPQGVVARQSSDFLAISHPVLHKAVCFIKDNHAKPITMEYIAQAAGISRRTLYYLFAEELGHSPACAPAQRAYGEGQVVALGNRSQDRPYRHRLRFGLAAKHQPLLLAAGKHVAPRLAAGESSGI